jgi:glycosyltransferase involved in cell wall biosynthesis
VSGLSVGLNLLHVTARAGGMHTYARELIPALLSAGEGVRLTAFAGRDVSPELRGADWAGEVDWVELPVSWNYDRPWNPVAMAGAQWAALPALASRRRLDVLHGLAGIGPLAHPGVTSVVTVHDAIWLRFPRTMSRRATLAMKAFVPPSARRAQRVIALSQAAGDDVSRRFRLDPGRVDVIPHGAAEPDPAEPEGTVRRALHLGDARVVACVAQLLPHKNLPTLIEAAAALPADVRLVLVGAPTAHEEELRAQAASLGLAERIRFAGWLPRARLEGLYALAAGIVLPSLEEGFGLPVLEAMRRGIPVACSDIPVLREVTNGTAILFEPLDRDELGGALNRLLDPDAAAQRARLGRERARLFDWERTGSATVATYEGARSRSSDATEPVAVP